MFICPDCNQEVVDPAYRPAPPWWARRRYESRRPMPICDRGHTLRRMAVGTLTELPFRAGAWRGFGVAAALLGLGIFEDITHRYRHGHGVGYGVDLPIGLAMMAAVVTGHGLVALWRAWSWAGRTGPAQRLSAGAFGRAMGSLAVACVAGHALYFGWSAGVETACAAGLVSLISDLASRA